MDIGEAKYSASAVAQWFLAENNRRMHEGDSDYITHLKLQKLLYYAQGCYVAETGNALFGDTIEAWTHGPVVPSVYKDYKAHGSDPIKCEGDLSFPEIDSETQGMLQEVFDVFGQYSAWKLREMTHEEDPWKNTQQNDVIPLPEICRYFEAEYIEK